MTSQERGALILKNAVVISGNEMKGVHDAQFVVVNDKAYVVFEANDIRPNENPFWDFIYATMCVVDLKTLKVERIYKVAQSEQAFSNFTLEKGCVFCPRIIKINDQTLRVFFTSEAPGSRPSHCYYRDFDLKSGEFYDNIGVFHVKTALGVGEFNNKSMLDAAQAAGVPAKDDSAPFLNCCTFIFDIFYDGDDLMAIVNCFWSGINALARFNDDFTAVEIVGFIGENSNEFKTTECGAVRTPDGSWKAVLREETKWNYLFSESNDGANWSKVHSLPLVTNGANSKPILRKLGDEYFLGFNHSDNDMPTQKRDKFTILTSSDCENWTEFAEIHAETTFQYPTLEFYNGKIYFSASVGNKEQIIFGEIIK